MPRTMGAPDLGGSVGGRIRARGGAKNAAATLTAPAAAADAIIYTGPSNQYKHDEERLRPIPLADIAALREPLAAIAGADVPSDTAELHDYILQARALQIQTQQFFDLHRSRYGTLSHLHARSLGMSVSERDEYVHMRTLRDQKTAASTKLTVAETRMKDLAPEALLRRREQLRNVVPHLRAACNSPLVGPAVKNDFERLQSDLQRIDDAIPTASWSELESLAAELHTSGKRRGKAVENDASNG